VPDRAALKRFARAGAALVVATLASGCGAKPPQAPPALANRVASALEGIAQACGESYQQTALPRFGPPSRGPEQAAAMRVLELAHVVRVNREWIYQGETLGEVAHLASERLRECGLAGHP
jgi:hypothetical protein